MTKKKTKGKKTKQQQQQNERERERRRENGSARLRTRDLRRRRAGLHRRALARRGTYYSCRKYIIKTLSPSTSLARPV